MVILADSPGDWRACLGDSSLGGRKGSFVLFVSSALSVPSPKESNFEAGFLSSGEMLNLIMIVAELRRKGSWDYWGRTSLEEVELPRTGIRGGVGKPREK